MGLFRKLFGSYSDRQIKKLKRVADAIEELAPKYAEMTNEELAIYIIRFMGICLKLLFDYFPSSFLVV